MKFFVVFYAKYVVCPLLAFLKMTVLTSLLNLLPCVWVFGPWSMWDLIPLTRDRTCTQCIGRQSLSRWTLREAPCPFLASKQWNNSHVESSYTDHTLLRGYVIDHVFYACVLRHIWLWDPKDCSSPVWVEAGSGKESWGWNEEELVDQTSNVPRIKEEPVLPLVPSLWPQKW